MRHLLIVAGMLVLALSASLTPANAWCGGRYFHSGGSWPICLCLGRCRGDAGAGWPWTMRPSFYAIAAAGALPAIETKRQACEATCVNAKQAARR
jgi:hypothetical protein